jgi:serine/threonine-protein kinase RsbW
MNTSPADRIRLEFPADTVNMAIARTVAAAVGARADLTMDQVEDVRLAMDEATAHMIRAATPGALISCDLWIQDHAVHASLSCKTSTHDSPEPEPFSWMVLSALVHSVDLETIDGVLLLRWSLTRDHSAPM